MRVIGVVSGKGGVGKTTVSSNLAVALAERGKRVLLVDFNPSTPHLNFHFGLFNYSFTVNDVLSGDASLESALYHHSSGVDIVPGSLSFSAVKNFDLDFSGLDYDYVILDSAPGLGVECLAALELCDEVLIVANPDYASVFDVLRLREVLNRKGVEILGLVLNNVFKKCSLKALDVQSLSGLPVTILIRNDGNIVRSLGENLPVMVFKRKCHVSRKFVELAAFVEGEKTPDLKASKWKSFMRMFTP